MLYRQGGMNLIVNSHRRRSAPATAALAAIALRVRDAGLAYQRSLDLGAWEMPTRAAAMELNIPGIHGVGDSLIYFVDRYRDFSIYDVDFVLARRTPIRNPPALAGLHWFGVVQSILAERTRDWLEFYRACSASRCCRSGQYFGVLPKGTLLESPCHKFYLQLIEPPPGAGGGRTGTRAWCASAWARPTCPPRSRAEGARHRVRRPRRGAAERQGRAHPGLSRRRHLRAGRQPSEAMNLDHFGMDTITLAGPLEAKLRRDARGRLHAGHAERRPTSSAIPAARRPRSRRCARAACASPASRCCATSRGSRATCTPTRWTSPRRCSRCATRSARRCCSPARRPPRTRPARP